MSEYLRRCWSRSKTFRVILVIAVIYTLLRIVIQGVYLVTLLSAGQSTGEELPEWVETEGPMIPDDLRIYLDAATRLRSKQDLYIQGTVDRMEFYQYAPSFALALIPLLWLPRGVVAIIHTLVNGVAYGLLYVWWGRIFRQLELDRASSTLIWTLPVWLIFSAFWSDLGYLNVYIILALLATLLIEAILEERLGWSLVWLSIILQIKPQWAFAAAVPLILGRHRFFAKLALLAILSYIAVAGVTMLAVGPSYGWQQHVDYARLLRGISSSTYPWRGPDAPFLGYNHSIKQVVIYLLGVTPSAMRLTMGIKVLLLVPLAVVSVRRLLRPANSVGRDAPQLSLNLAFALYLGAFIWLDVVWELSLGIAVFTYLLAVLSQSGAKVLVWAVFLPYALVDFFQVFGYVAFGQDAVLPGLYIVTDPSIYVPLVLIVILVFYALLIKRLWVVPMRRGEKVR